MPTETPTKCRECNAFPAVDGSQLCIRCSPKRATASHGENCRAEVQRIEAQLATVTRERDEANKRADLWTKEAEARKASVVFIEAERDEAREALEVERKAKQAAESRATELAARLAEVEKERELIVEHLPGVIQHAEADPGHYTPRGENYGEALGSWQARAREIAKASLFRQIALAIAALPPAPAETQQDAGSEGRK